MRLHIGAVGAKNLFHAVDGELFGNVDKLAATVIAFAWVAFGVFVRQLRALRGHHGGAGVVFAGDEFDVVFLALVFGFDSGKNFWISLLDQLAFQIHDGSLSKGREGGGLPRRTAENGRFCFLPLRTS